MKTACQNESCILGIPGSSQFLPEGNAGGRGGRELLCMPSHLPLQVTGGKTMEMRKHHRAHT